MIQHTNRRGQTYYLHKGTTKSGRPNWYFSMKQPPEPVLTVPDGYEIYENPEAQVFLRKIRPSVITDDELKLARNVFERLAKTRHIIVDREPKHMVVYAADTERLEELTQRLSPFVSYAKLDQIAEDNARYEAMFRFTPGEGPQRKFTVNRWCFSGSIDTWIYLDAGPLAAMLKKYAPHLGAESFFELI